MDEIEVKIRCKDGEGGVQSVRLMASSMGGKWLEVKAFLEYPDPVTGVTRQFCPINDEGVNPDGRCFIDPYPASNKLQTKRAIVRRIESTYAYDFMGLMEVTSKCALRRARISSNAQPPQPDRSVPRWPRKLLGSPLSSSSSPLVARRRQVDLIQRWGRHLEDFKAAGLAAGSMPTGLFAASELILDETGVLRDDIEREVRAGLFYLQK